MVAYTSLRSEGNTSDASLIHSLDVFPGDELNGRVQEE